MVINILLRRRNLFLNLAVSVDETSLTLAIVGNLQQLRANARERCWAPPHSSYTEPPGPLSSKLFGEIQHPPPVPHTHFSLEGAPSQTEAQPGAKGQLRS